MNLYSNTKRKNERNQREIAQWAGVHVFHPGGPLCYLDIADFLE